MRLAYFARYAFVLPLVAACADANTVAPKGDDPFALQDSGKADGAGLLSAEDERRIEVAFDNVIAGGEATIISLEAEIARLEASHLQKQREADDLVNRIASREQELRNQYNNNLILCAFFPNPAICIFANYLANDSTLSSYKTQLEAARREQTRIATSINEYRGKRDTLRAKLAPIRDSKQRLLSLLHSGTTAPVPIDLADSPETATAYQRAIVMGKVTTAINSEIAILVDIRNAAVELANTLDQSLATLRALEQSVDELVQKQREQFMDLLSAFISGDPAAAAEKWLEDQIAARTRALLDTLAWPINEYARFLVETKGTGNLDELLQHLLQKLGSTTPELPPLVVRADAQVGILDNTDAQSAITVSETRPLTALEVFVDIQHTFIGDLVVSLEHDGKRFVLSNRIGGSTHDLVRTFAITDLSGVSLAGRWTLHVEDQADIDTGTLRRWELVAR